MDAILENWYENYNLRNSSEEASPQEPQVIKITSIEKEGEEGKEEDQSTPKEKAEDGFSAEISLALIGMLKKNIYMLEGETDEEKLKELKIKNLKILEKLKEVCEK